MLIETLTDNGALKAKPYKPKNPAASMKQCGALGDHDLCS